MLELARIAGNEMADKLAKVGAEILAQRLYLGVSKSTATKNMQECMDYGTNQALDNACGQNQSKGPVKKISRKKFAKHLKLEAAS